MKILNPKLEKDLEEGKTIKLDVGCGTSKRDGFYALDHLPLEDVDVIADLNQPLDLLPSNSVEHFHARHVLEHITEFLPLIREIHRIVKPDGLVEIIVPHFSNVYGYSDPTHVRFFGLYSMYYFVPLGKQPRCRKVPTFYAEERFVMDSVRIEFYRSSILDKVLAPPLSMLVNLSARTQDFYERRLSNLFHAWEIKYVLRPIK